MKYTVDPAEVGTALAHVRRAARASGPGASRALERAAQGLPAGTTATVLPDLLRRWSGRAGRVEQGLAAQAARLEQAARGYTEAEVQAAARLGEGA